MPSPPLPQGCPYLTPLQEHCQRLGPGCQVVLLSTFTPELPLVVPVEAIAVLEQGTQEGEPHPKKWPDG